MTSPSGLETGIDVAGTVALGPFFNDLLSAGGKTISAADKVPTLIEGLFAVITDKALWIRAGLLILGNGLIVAGLVAFFHKSLGGVAESAKKVGEVAALV